MSKFDRAEYLAIAQVDLPIDPWEFSTDLMEKLHRLTAWQKSEESVKITQHSGRNICVGYAVEDFRVYSKRDGGPDRLTILNSLTKRIAPRSYHALRSFSSAILAKSMSMR